MFPNNKYMSFPFGSGSLDAVNEPSSRDLEDHLMMIPVSSLDLSSTALYSDCYDLWPRPILSPNCVSCIGSATALPKSCLPLTWPSKRLIEPNQGPLCETTQTRDTRSHFLRQHTPFTQAHSFVAPASQRPSTIDGLWGSRILKPSKSTTAASLDALGTNWMKTNRSSFSEASALFDQDIVTITPSRVFPESCSSMVLPVPSHESKIDDLLSASTSTSADSLLLNDVAMAEKRFRDHQNQQWDEAFDELVEYRERYGNCQVPHGFAGSQSLARWVKRQRYQYKLMKLGKPGTMNEERIKRLEAIGFIWESHNSVWDERISQIRKFKEQYGKVPVPKNCKRDLKLANWIKQQRRQYTLLCQGRPSTITLERIEQLQSMGFLWCHRRHQPTGPSLV